MRRAWVCEALSASQRSWSELGRGRKRRTRSSPSRKRALTVPCEVMERTGSSRHAGNWALTRRATASSPPGRSASSPIHLAVRPCVGAWVSASLSHVRSLHGANCHRRTPLPAAWRPFQDRRTDAEAWLRCVRSSLADRNMDRSSSRILMAGPTEGVSQDVLSIGSDAGRRAVSSDGRRH